MIRVVVVEDSLVQRTHLVRILEADHDISVVGQAAAADEAVDMIRQLRPDAVTLDLQIPGGGGQTVIEQVMATDPIPILVLSATLSGRESESAVDALVAGAVEALPKPTRWDDEVEHELRRQVRVIRNVAVVRHPRGRPRVERPTTPAVASPSAAVPVVAIGASTGGPAALAQVLGGLGGTRAAMLVVQHLHEDFVDGFVGWMARSAAVPVELAVDGSRLRAGVALIASGGVHLRVGPGLRVVLDPEPPMLHRPSVDVLFSSVAANVKGPKVGVLLTGMGDDGAKGLLAMKRAGATTLAQDEATSAVYGMPRAADQLGAAQRVLPLERMAAAVRRAVQ